jgi:hypothetical protein
MAAISNFENMEIWKLARKQAHAIFQLYSTEKFEELVLQNNLISKKITSFIKYLKQSELKGFRYK